MDSTLYKVPLEKYRRSPPPTLAESQPKYLQEELRKLELVLDSNNDGLNELGQWRVSTDSAILELQSTVTGGQANILQNYYTKAATDSAIAASATTLTSNFNTTLQGYTSNSYLQTNYYTKTATDSAIALANTSLSTSFDNKLANYTTTANLQANYYTKSATDAAIASSSSTLTTNFNNTLQGYVTNSTLTNNYYTKSATDSAIATSSNSLTSTFDNKLTGYATTASLSSEASTRASADSALSSQINTLSATTNGKNRTFLQSSVPTATATGDLWFDTLNGNLLKRWDGTNWVSADDTRLAANTAAISTETNARVTADSALSQQITSLSSTVNSNTAAISNESTARANADNVLAQQISTVSSTTNGNTTSIQTLSSSVDGVKGRYGVTINNNGYVSGISLLSDSSNGNPTSVFRVSADKFAVRSPNASTDSFYWDANTSRLVVSGDIYANSFNGTGVVGTGNIVNNAVTAAYWSTSTSTITINQTSATLGSVTFNATGAPVLLTFSFFGFFTYTRAANASLIFKRGATTILTITPVMTYSTDPIFTSYQLIDQPPAGSVTYSVVFNSGSNDTYWNYRTLTVTELKR